VLNETPSVYVPIQFSQDRPFVSRFEENTFLKYCDGFAQGIASQQQ
jgi:hypothetical protein